MDRNYFERFVGHGKRRSLSARRAWIEIAPRGSAPHPVPVALRKESVDRNAAIQLCRNVGIVVALRKESVDRNVELIANCFFDRMSLSARRAWIEIERI